MAALLAAPEVFAFLTGGGTPDGAGFILARAAGGEAEILAVGVLADARGQGIGAKLVDAAAREATDRGAEAIFLEVAEDNSAARALYQRCRFQVVGRRPGYYVRPGETVAALILRRDLGVS